MRGAQARAEHEVGRLVDAAIEILSRSGAWNLTVADVLAEAGLSTRAFYRHFASRDELIFAVFDREHSRVLAGLWSRVNAAPDPRSALEAWVDGTLGLGFDRRRARRTEVLAVEGIRLQREFPEQFLEIELTLRAPLVELLARGKAMGMFPDTDPVADSQSIHAVVWDLVRGALAGDPRTRAAARAQVLRFSLPALGAVR